MTVTRETRPLGRGAQDRWDDERAVDLLLQAVSTPSHSGDERAVAELLVGAARSTATEAFVDEAGNAVATWGAGPTLITFLGHMDTVPGHIDVRVENGVLHGRGAVDAKGSLCAALVAASRAPAEVWRALTFRFIGAVEEEAPTSRGARHAVDTYPAPHMLIVGEPSGWERYTLGYKGRLGVRLRVSRPVAHSSREEPTAAEVAVGAFTTLSDWVTHENEAATGLFDRLQLSLLSMTSSSDGLEESCSAELSFRLPLRWCAEAVREELMQRLPGLDLEFGMGMDACRAEAGTELARAFRVAVRAQGGRPAPVLKTGTSDLNVVAPRWKVPAVAYGPGDSNLDHTPEERIDLAEYLRATAVLQQVLVELSGSRH